MKDSGTRYMGQSQGKSPILAICNLGLLIHCFLGRLTSPLSSISSSVRCRRIPPTLWGAVWLHEKLYMLCLSTVFDMYDSSK